jgi:hypothetical protein
VSVSRSSTGTNKAISALAGSTRPGGQLTWVYWLHFMTCLVAEAIATARGRIATRVPAGRLNQALASRLIGAILLLAPAGTPLRAAAAAVPPAHAAYVAPLRSQRSFAMIPALPIARRGSEQSTLWGDLTTLPRTALVASGNATLSASGCRASAATRCGRSPSATSAMSAAARRLSGGLRSSPQPRPAPPGPARRHLHQSALDLPRSATAAARRRRPPPGTANRAVPSPSTDQPPHTHATTGLTDYRTDNLTTPPTTSNRRAHHRTVAADGTPRHGPAPRNESSRSGRGGTGRQRPARRRHCRRSPGSAASNSTAAAATAEGRWRAVNGPHLVALVRAGARFERGKLVERPEEAPDEEINEVAA